MQLLLLYHSLSEKALDGLWPANILHGPSVPVHIAMGSYTPRSSSDIFAAAGRSPGVVGSREKDDAMRLKLTVPYSQPARLKILTRLGLRMQRLSSCHNVKEDKVVFPSASSAQGKDSAGGATWKGSAPSVQDSQTHLPNPRSS